jgi:tetratricopeptide (TPR) repeat protein
MNTGRYEEARELLERALAILDASPAEPNPVAVSGTLVTLAQCLQKLGEPEEALRLARRLLTHREREWGEDSPVRFGALFTLAWLHMEQGDLETARPLYREAAGLWPGEYGATYISPGLPKNESFHRLARLVRDAGERDDALRLYDIAVKFWAMGHAGFPGHASALEEYAGLLREAGRETEASEQEAEAAAIRKKLSADSKEKKNVSDSRRREAS